MPIQVVVFDSKAIRLKNEKMSLKRNEAAQYLGVELPNTVSRLLADSKSESLSLADQEQAFADLADRFHQHGIYDKARTLREIVLFINSDNVQQRLDWMREPGPVNRVYERKERFEHVDHIIRNKLVTIPQGCMLIRMFIDPDSQVEYSEKIHKKPLENALPHHDCHLAMTYFAPLLFRLPFNDEKTVPLNFGPYASIDDAELLPVCQYEMILELAYDYIIRCKATVHRDMIYEDLFQVLADSPECFYLYGFTDNPWRHGGTRSLKEYVTHHPEKWREFKEKLRLTKRNDLILAADFYDLYESYVENERPDENSIPLLDRMIERARAMTLSEAGQEVLVSLMLLRANIDKELGYRQARATAIVEPTPVEQSVKSTVSRKKDESAKPDPEAKIILEMIPQWRENLQTTDPFFEKRISSDSSESYGKIPYHFFFPEPHNENETIAWNRSAVYLCHMKDEELVTRRIFTYELQPNDESRIIGGWPSAIMRVRSDGRNIWIASPHGIHCVDGEGKTIALFDESVGLPAYRTAFHDFAQGVRVPGRAFNKNLLWHELDSTVRDCATTAIGKISKGVAVLSLYPLGDDECLAMGRAGANQRTWLAKLSFDKDGSPVVTTLHIAPRDLPEVEKIFVQAGAAPENIDVLFNIAWVTRFDDPLFSQRKQILLGRDWGMHHSEKTQQWEHYKVVPLLIDFETNDVMLASERYPAFEELTAMQTVAIANGHVIAFDGRHVYSFDRKPDGTFVKTLLNLEYPATFYHDTPRRYWLIADGSDVYSPGTPWFKLDCSHPHETPDITKPANWSVPDAGALERYVVTAPFGICCVCLCPQISNCGEECVNQCGNLFRIHIAAEDAAPQQVNTIVTQ